MENLVNHLSIRVYGILENSKEEVLVSKEWIRGAFYNKFPGGGLELGESTIDAVRREFIEELDCKINVGEHLYTTDFFVRSTFERSAQVIAIYYSVKLSSGLDLNLSDLNLGPNNKEEFSWKKKNELKSEYFSFKTEQMFWNKWTGN